MLTGLEAAKAVMKINVPAFENGSPKNQSNGTQMIAHGTAWLLTSSLVVTNHHVINARRENEPEAVLADLQFQASKATVIFDFNDQSDDGTTLEAKSLEAWDRALDYAIIRIDNSGRIPIRLARNKLLMGEDPIAVNIIQHPVGESKKFAIRNNLVSASTENDLRYFTDTETGSSGAPVFNDQWEAVALHRGATSVNNVSFQGKTTAFVNVGTHLSVIFSHVKTNFPALMAELTN
jgi:V8-like Glu-specific endopeptidase